MNPITRQEWTTAIWISCPPQPWFSIQPWLYGNIRLLYTYSEWPISFI